MDEKQILYKDDQLMVTYLELPDDGGFSTEEHELHIAPEGRYVLMRDVLKTIIKTTRSNLPSLLDRIHPQLNADLLDKGLTPDAVGFSAAQAYIEEANRFRRAKYIIEDELAEGIAFHP